MASGLQVKYSPPRPDGGFLTIYGNPPYQVARDPWAHADPRRLSKETKESVITYTSLAAPKAARKAFPKAQKTVDQAQPNFVKAAILLQEAVAVYPDYAAAWTLLGRVQHSMGDTAAAVEALSKAITIDPRYLEPVSQLAYIAVATEQYPQVLQLAKHMFSVNPLFTLGYYYSGIAHWKTGELESARKALEDAKLTPDAKWFPDTHYVLGEVYREQQ